MEKGGGGGGVRPPPHPPPPPLQRFLTENGLRLVLRSHEGPDAREGRDDMLPMAQGWTLDHDTPAGQLMTVFRCGSPGPPAGPRRRAAAAPNAAWQWLGAEVQTRSRPLVGEMKL